MSTESQANMGSPWPGASGAKPDSQGAKRPNKGVITHRVRTFLLVLVCGLLAGSAIAFLARYISLQSSDSTAQASAGPSATNGGAEAIMVSEVDKTELEATMLAGMKRNNSSRSRYRVEAEKAYLFNTPQQSTPLKRYLRRGDVFYADSESNGFVRTGFVQPNGAQGAGWLKSQELKKLPEDPESLADNSVLPTASAATVAAAKSQTTARKAARRSATARNSSRKPAEGTRVGAWLRRARETVLPRDGEGMRRKKKKSPCKCAMNRPLYSAQA